MSQGQAYKNKVKPETIVWFENNYPNFITYISQLLSFEPIWSYKGETTADGAADGSTLICSELTSLADFDGNLMVIASGPYKGQARDINGSTTGGTVTPSLVFGGQITSGTSFIIYALRLVPAEVAALTTLVNDIEDKLDHPDHGLAGLLTEITALAALVNDIEDKLDHPDHGLAALLDEINDNEALITDIKFQTDKTAGEAPVSGSTTKNWNTGVATSGEAGGDLVTIGTADTRYKIHSLIIDIGRGGLVGTDIHVKLFMEVNGVERKVYEQSFDATTDAPGLWIINGTVGIHEALRVELESDVIGDDAKEVHYDYMLEEM